MRQVRTEAEAEGVSCCVMMALQNWRMEKAGENRSGIKAIRGAVRHTRARARLHRRG
jgi:hypothetical protein